MPILAALSLIIQVGFCIHCVQTGRDRQWLYFILFVPVIGSLVYFFTQVLPDMGDNRAVRRAVGGLARAVDPHGELRKRKDALEISDSVENRIQLADECMEVSFFEDAEVLYDSCLTGHHADDPSIRLKLAHAQFRQEKFPATRESLEALIKEHPDFRSAEGHLLYTRTLEALDDPGVAEEYDALLASYPGEEARVRYAQWLERRGEPDKARKLYDEVLLRARRSPKYYRRTEKHWIDIASKKVS